MQAISHTRQKHYSDHLLVMVAIVLGVFVNCFPISFVSGATLLFGNIFAIVIVARIGLLTGILVSILCSLPTLYHWGHFLAFPPFLFEIIFIHLAIKKNINPILVGTVYWLTFGALLVFTSYYYFSSFSETTQLAIFLKYIVNGILTTSLGYCLHLFLPKFKNKKINKVSLSFHHLVLMIIYFSVTIGICLNTYFWLQQAKQYKLDEFKSALATESKLNAKSVENYIFNTLDRLSLVADGSGQSFERPKAQELSLLASKSPGILTMLVSDETGQISSTYPSYLVAEVEDSQNIIKQREYFTQVQQYLEPYVSEVFEGKGFGSDPIVALSVPIKFNEKFKGILQAALSLSYFKTLDQKTVDTTQSFLLLDANNKVIYSSPGLKYQYLQDLSNSSLLSHINSSEDFYFLDQNRHGFLVSESMIDTLGWKTIIFLPRHVYQRSLIQVLVNGVLLLFGFIGISMVFAYIVSTRISRPIAKITQKLNLATEQGTFDRINIQNDAHVTEINALTQILNKLSNKYETSLRSLEEAVRQANLSNSELERINVNLEQIIKDKTKDISSALANANRANKAKSRFLANMSHEIRTPLNGIYGTLQVLQSKQNAHPANYSLLDQALFSARSLKAIINDILDFSKIEAGELSLEKIPFTLQSLLKNVVSDFASNLKNKDVSLILDISPSAHKALIGDPFRVRQIITNLVSNAVKFTEHGEIKISAQHVQLENGEYLLQIDVLDTGIGMSDTTMKTLFDRYTQADLSTTRRFGGTGLGMSITQELVNLMGGHIQCKSQIDKGTQFLIDLAIEPANTELAPELCPTNKDSLPDLSKYKIALVEDNDINTEVLRALLEPSGVQIFTAKNGKEGVALCTKLKPDIVLMDIHMPVMDGIQATQIIKTRLPSAIVIAVTANVMKMDIEQYKHVGCCDFIAKPVERSELARVINKCLALNQQVKDKSNTC